MLHARSLEKFNLNTLYQKLKAGALSSGLTTKLSTGGWILLLQQSVNAIHMFCKCDCTLKSF